MIAKVIWWFELANYTLHIAGFAVLLAVSWLSWSDYSSLSCFIYLLLRLLCFLYHIVNEFHFLVRAFFPFAISVSFIIEFYFSQNHVLWYLDLNDWRVWLKLCICFTSFLEFLYYSISYYRFDEGNQLWIRHGNRPAHTWRSSTFAFDIMTLLFFLFCHYY